MVKGGKKQLISIIGLIIIMFIIAGCSSINRYAKQRYLNRVKTILEEPDDDISSLEKDFSLFDGTIDSANKLLPKYKQAREDFIDARNELKDVDPPETYNKLHKDLLKNLDRGTELYTDLTDMAEYILKSNLIILRHLEDSDAFEMAYQNTANKEQKISIIESYLAELNTSYLEIEKLSNPDEFENVKDEEIIFFKSLIKQLKTQEKLIEQGKVTDVISKIGKENKKLSFSRVIGENAKVIGSKKSDVDDLMDKLEELEEK